MKVILKKYKYNVDFGKIGVTNAYFINPYKSYKGEIWIKVGCETEPNIFKNKKEAIIFYSQKGYILNFN